MFRNLIITFFVVSCPLSAAQMVSTSGCYSLGPTEGEPDRRIRPPAPCSRLPQCVIKIVSVHAERSGDVVARRVHDADHIRHVIGKVRVADARTEKNPGVANRLRPGLMEQRNQMPTHQRIASQAIIDTQVSPPYRV